MIVVKSDARGFAVVLTIVLVGGLVVLAVVAKLVERDGGSHGFPFGWLDDGDGDGNGNGD
jgi:hypothetical protein